MVSHRLILALSFRKLDSDQGVMDPWTALDHYLSKGMEQGLSLY